MKGDGQENYELDVEIQLSGEHSKRVLYMAKIPICLKALYIITGTRCKNEKKK